MKPDDRRNALTVCESNLIWLTIGNLTRATQILTNNELQSAIIAAQNYAGVGAPTDGTIAYSDPTGQNAIRAGATALRATEVRRCWLGELAGVYEAIARLREMTSRAHHDAVLLDQPANIATAVRTLRWLTMIPANRANTIHHHLQGEDLAEYDHAIGFAHDRSTALRSGTLTTSSGKRCPSVHGVLEAARKVTENAPPPPVQKPMEGCVSCKRDNGYFEAIDTKNHSARSMCRVCGDYASGEGEWLPVDAVKYRHRTGKQLTWKIIEEAKRTERAS